jgi:hypothetical protein
MLISVSLLLELESWKREKKLQKKKKLLKELSNVSFIFSKLLVMFRTYDFDGNGYITPDEVYRIFKNVKDAEGKPYK